MLFFKKTYVLDNSNKYTKRMICKLETVEKKPFSCFTRVHIKFLYNSKFDFTAKTLVTNAAVNTRVLCIQHFRRVLNKEDEMDLPVFVLCQTIRQG